MSESSTNSFYSDEIFELRFKQQNGCCFWCGLPLSKETQRDHVIPRARGGENRVVNMVLSHRTCNVDKRDNLPWNYFGHSEWAGIKESLAEITNGQFGKYLTEWERLPEHTKNGEMRFSRSKAGRKSSYNSEILGMLPEYVARMRSSQTVEECDEVKGWFERSAKRIHNRRRIYFERK